MFLVTEKENSRCLASIRHYCSIHHYCLFLKDMGWKHTTYHIINSNPGHTRSKQQLGKTLIITFASLSRKSNEKEKKKKTRMAIEKNYNGNNTVVYSVNSNYLFSRGKQEQKFWNNSLSNSTVNYIYCEQFFFYLVIFRQNSMIF